MTLTLNAERLAVELSLPALQLSRQGFACMQGERSKRHRHRGCSRYLR